MGSGGQASVWLCHDLFVGREVAVKVVDFEGDPDRARRAEREIRALQRLTDPHTVRVLDTARDDGDHYVYIVMPVVTGESLADRLRRGRMGAADVVSIIRGVSSSLGEAHAQGICHRDVKPGNIMIHTSGAAVLLDFGIASSLDQTSSLTAAGIVVGTPTYMAPEVIYGEKATPASDVYFLGAVMYECACGRPPFKADTMHALLMAITHGNYPPPSCATELRGLIVQMLDPDPGQRPTAQDLLVRLAAIRTSITSQTTEHAGTRTARTTRTAGSTRTARTARIVSSTRARAEQPTSATWRLTTPATRMYTEYRRQPHKAVPVLLVQRDELGALTFIASGGFGEVFRTGFRLPGYRGALAYKELKSSLPQDRYSRAVEAMRQAVRLRDSMSDGGRSDLDEVTVWPLALVEEGGVVRGCLMPLIRPEFFAELHPPATGKKDSKTRELRWLPVRPAMLQRAGFSQDQIDEFSGLPVRMRILAWLVYSVALLHSHGVVYGDMSLKNAVFCLGEHPRSVLMDCDGVARQDDVSRRQANSPFFLAPECEEPGRNPFARGRAHFQDTRTDVYKLGLCVVRCLSRGLGAMQRKSADHLTGQLSPECLDVIKASLSQDPDQRPTAKQLYHALLA